jgi:uncharacterized protein YjbI with pentapeptide repeats
MPIEAQIAVITTIVGGLLGITGTIVGIFAQEILAGRRATEDKREHWIQTALEWAAHGRKDSLRRVDLRGADLRGVDLGTAIFPDKGADLSYANLVQADLTGAKLTKADFTGANLSDACLSQAALGSAILSRAKLVKADLSNADIHWANLCGANLEGADLQGANLSQVDYDDSTRWPTGFTPPPDATKVTEGQQQ